MEVEVDVPLSLDIGLWQNLHLELWPWAKSSWTDSLSGKAKHIGFTRDLKGQQMNAACMETWHGLVIHLEVILDFLST